MNEFKREERYIVVKLKHLAGLQVAPLRNFLRQNHVPTLDCVVVESDWPEYEKVWQSIERRMTGQPAVTAAEEREAVLHWRDKHAQIIKERDALQLLLNDRDEQLHTLEQSRWAHFESGQAAEQSNAILLGLLERWYEANCNDLVHVEDGAYRIVLDTNEALNGKSVASKCTWSREDDCGTWQSACGVNWSFLEDGPIENGMNFCHACGDCIAVEEPAEEISTDDDIPDFSPGNGNKARRRAETIQGFKVIEDPTLAPGEMKLVQPAAKVDDSFSTCLGCFGTGTVSTGIEEASSTICNGCDGTGREQA